MVEADRKNRTLIEQLEPWSLFTNPHNKTPYELISGKVPHIGTQETNINAGTQDLTQIQKWKSTRAAKLQRQENEQWMQLQRYGYLFTQGNSRNTMSRLKQKIRSPIVSAVRDPAGIDSAVRDTAAINSAGGVSAGSPSAGSDPAGTFNLSGSPQITGDLASPIPDKKQSSKNPSSVESAFIGYIQDQQRTNHTDQLHCLSACFLSQLEPTSIAKALEDPDWVDAMQEEMQQFINQQVWKLVPLPAGKHAIGTKWILKNKRDARGNSSLYDSSSTSTGMQDCRFSVQHNYRRGTIDKDTCSSRKIQGYTSWYSQDKYVKDMLTKFDMESVRTATTPYEAAKTKLKDETDPPVNVHLYRSMIGSLMYLTASKPDIMFAVSWMSFRRQRRLISWQCKSRLLWRHLLTRRPDMLLAASYCAHVLWIQNQMLDYGFNFKIHESHRQPSTILHWEALSNLEVEIHTNDNVADLLTKAFDGPRFEYLVVHIGMVVNTAARCTFFLLTGLVSAGRTMILLVVILSAGCFVSAGSYGLCCWFRVHAGGHTSAGGFISADRVYVPALDVAGWFSLSAQYNLFRPKPVISEPPSKRQRVDSDTSQPSGVPAASTQPADDPDSAGGSSFHPAGSAPPLSGSAAPTTAGDVFGVPDSTVSTSAAMDSADSCRNIGVSPFADSAAGGINEFFLDSDEDEQIGMSRVAADPDSDDEVLAEIIFRGKSISGDGVVVVDKLPDDEIVDPRVKVETVSDSASSPPRSR
ncbi:hypothetical protein Tco_1034727, partial [Tanacetum coccineum]